jgi:hypothetical protein
MARSNASGRQAEELKEKMQIFNNRSKLETG